VSGSNGKEEGREYEGYGGRGLERTKRKGEREKRGDKEVRRRWREASATRSLGGDTVTGALLKRKTLG